ncbi:CYTH domain-containing protein [Paraburkholderia sp. A3RO-2L]|jgi:adenylate cyclase|uniref:CYTH domain-containing protein n=1 Tax=Paraburkholderia sp. A3RO-2L TaxID=3028376 RepID=UPI003DA7CAB4
MATENERKFLVRSDDWRASVARTTRIHQGYLSLDPSRTVRIRLRDDAGLITVKGMTAGISRPEFEYGIPAPDAKEMLGMCLGSVDKHRHEVPNLDGHVWEVDVFEGLNAPLILAELELAHAADRFARPAWLGAEVTHNPAYFNSALATNPYSLWPTTLNPVQASHVEKVPHADTRKELTTYLLAGVDVDIFRQSEVEEAPPYAICVANTEFWVDCCHTIDEAAALSKSLGLYVASTRA